MAKKKSLGKDNFLHLIRYGITSDQKYLLGDFLGTYDMAVLNANMVVHAPSALSTFIFEHSLSKPFIIDPQTYLFERDLKHIRSKSKGKSKGLIKKAFVKLAEIYGEVFTNRIEEEDEINPTTVSKNISDIVTNVCEFQINFLIDQTKEEDVEKYYEFSSEEGDLDLNRTPEFLIPPYFYLDEEQFDSWLSVNVDLIKETAMQYPKEKITPQIVLSKEVMNDQKKFDALISAYTKVGGIHAILIWIDEHIETQLSSTEIHNFFSFVNSLGKKHSVINLYGGGLSIIAGRGKVLPNLIGVCHSIEFGESKPVNSRGGVPVSKFYLPSMYHRFLYRDVISILKNNDWLKTTQTYFKNVCTCSTCKSVIIKEPDNEFGAFGAMNIKKKRTPDGKEISRQYPTGDARDLCKRHYMYCKHFEYMDTRFEDIDNVILDLKKASQHLSKGFASEKNHLKTWSKCLEDEIAE